MITTEHNETRLRASIFGEFALADLKELEDQVAYRLEFKGKINLLLDLTEMVKYTIDTVVEEFRFGKNHPGAFEKVAVLTDSQWIGSLAWAFNLFTDADVKVFHDSHEAEGWLAA